MYDDPEAERLPHGPIEVAIAEPCALWRRGVADLEHCCETAARAALAAADARFAGGAELSIVLGDDAMLRALNRQWRGRDKPTNVLSFATREGERPPGAPCLLGDVVLAFETVAAEARAQGKPMAHHLCHLVVHGVLHLLGFDHEHEADAERMEALETEILAGLGIADPYEPTDPVSRVETADG
jgi:probable rRNA maturation factor